MELPIVSEGRGAGRTRQTNKTSLDYLLEGESIKTNPYLRAFQAFKHGALVEALSTDPKVTERDTGFNIHPSKESFAFFCFPRFVVSPLRSIRSFEAEDFAWCLVLCPFASSTRGGG